MNKTNDDKTHVADTAAHSNCPAQKEIKLLSTLRNYSTIYSATCVVQAS